MKRRDVRRFGPGPYLLGLKRVEDAPWGTGFPYELPAVDGGRGARPQHAGDAALGRQRQRQVDADRAAGRGDRLRDRGRRARALGRAPGRSAPGARRHPRARARALVEAPHGLLSAAESFFNVAAFVDSEDTFAPDLSLYGDVPLHQQSHGESFLALATNRFGGEGLYILDEPEAALSVPGALALLAAITRAARAGAQFIVATHSPILLACPGARIYELHEQGLSECAYDDLDVVRITRGFLENPERYLRAVLNPAS